MKIRPVGAEFFHADGQTDRYGETQSIFAILRTRIRRDVLHCCFEIWIP